MALSLTDHKRLSRNLVAACGGYEKAAEACRVSVSKLHGYGDKNSPSFMPADVISDLECEAREPIYSKALIAGFHEDHSVVDDLKEATCSVSEETVDLQRAVRAAMADGRLTASEQDDLIGSMERIIKDITKLRDTVRTAREPAGLRAV